MNYHNLTYPDMNNGEGLRVVLWLSGCSHKCKGCQNPQTWNANSGISFDEQAKEELFRKLNKDYISGLTLTGGDPLFESNLDNVLDLVNEIRLSLPQKSIWLYTGYTIYFTECCKEKVLSAKTNNYTLDAAIPTALREKILEKCDVVVDGRYIEAQHDVTLHYRGSKNQRLINIQESLQKGEIVLWQI